MTGKCLACGNDIDNGRGHAWNCSTKEVRETRESQPLVSVEASVASSGLHSRSPFVARYLDLYRTARLLVGLGTTVKGIGIVAAIVIFLFWLIVGFVALSQSPASSPFGPSPATESAAQTVTFFVCIVIGAIFGALVGGLFFLLGVLISAQGQLLKAHADSAVHTSPFLSDEERAAAMSLSYTATTTAATPA
jgi:hypothetical protein